MASSQKLVPIALSIPKAYLTVLRILNPNFLVYPISLLDLGNDSISPTPYILNPPLKLRIFLLLAIGYTAYSAISTVSECLKLTKGTYSEDLPFHSTYKVQTIVLIFSYTFPDLIVSKPLTLSISDASLQ